MRTVFAHDAVLAMESQEDLQAPGGAITAALCEGPGEVRPDESGPGWGLAAG